MKRKTLLLLLLSGIISFFSNHAAAQTEVMAWGNMTGIRIDGELVEFESGFRVPTPDWSYIHATGKERQYRPQYTRDGQKQIVHTSINRILFDQTVVDVRPGVVDVFLKARADTTLATGGVYFCMEFPEQRYNNAAIRIGSKKIQVSGINKIPQAKTITGKNIEITGNGRHIRMVFPQTVKTFIRKEPGSAATLYIEMLSPEVTKRNEKELQFSIHADATIDHSLVEITVDPRQPGRLFEGLGGNFRLQNPRVDPQVIDYCLDNLRVAWGRVEMPWRNWHPEEDTDPLAEARAGRLDKRVEDAMKMAARLRAIGMPVIVSAWFPPAWAIDGGPDKYPRQGGVQAFRLDPDKQKKIYKSLTDYLVYLKEAYGVEAVMYSFNESDIGIDVLHTAREHADFIKGLGAYMASRGLATRMLLGDNSDATTYDFILPAMNDPETHKYIGAVSFHSWRGCDDETLLKWGDAARKLNVPLIIGEGSTDAAAHVYPQIFAQSTFALYEINLYTRICAISQPLSILQWQLTSDYSILWGGGVYGSEGPLRPTQRFWNLKQLASTPEQSFALPVVSTKEDVNCAAFGNIARGEYAVHMVNNGAAKPVHIKGLPESKEYTVYATNYEKGMEQITGVNAENGALAFELPEMSFVTVIAR